MDKNLIGLLIIITLLTFSIGLSQEVEKANYKTTVNTFTSHYNKGNYQAIYNMFDANFKQVFTLDKVKTFFKEEINADALGKIEERTLNSIVRTGHNYTFTFENGTCTAFFLLDEANQIKGFQMYKKQ